MVRLAALLSLALVGCSTVLPEGPEGEPGEAGPQGPRGERGSQGPQGEAGSLGPTHTVVKTEDVPSGGANVATAACPEGSRALSGGCLWGNVDAYASPLYQGPVLDGQFFDGAQPHAWACGGVANGPNVAIMAIAVCEGEGEE